MPNVVPPPHLTCQDDMHGADKEPGDEAHQPRGAHASSPASHPSWQLHSSAVPSSDHLRHTMTADGQRVTAHIPAGDQCMGVIARSREGGQTSSDHPLEEAPMPPAVYGDPSPNAI